jgi:predicted small secreted protein
MMKLGKTVSVALIMSALLVALGGCQKQEGPAEQAGKNVDKAVDKVGEQIEKAGDSIQDAAKGDKK